MLPQSHSKGRVHWPTLRGMHIVWVKLYTSAESNKSIRIAVSPVMDIACGKACTVRVWEVKFGVMVKNVCHYDSWFKSEIIS